MYTGAGEHSSDCRKYPFEDVPRRIFLDTNVVNLLVKYRSEIFEREKFPETVAPEIARDSEALMRLMQIGFRAEWKIVISAKTIEEIENTRDCFIRSELLDYAWEVVNYQSEGGISATMSGLGPSVVDKLSAMPDQADRVLLADAIGFGCDVFCTRDIRTIVSKRDMLPNIPIRILTPLEWWCQVKPWAGLWV